jgi:hypothetical protein
LLNRSQEQLSRENDELLRQLEVANASARASEGRALLLEGDKAQLQSRLDDAQSATAAAGAKLATSEAKVSSLVSQVKGKTNALKALQKEGPTLKRALSTATTRHTILLPALVGCLAPGVRDAAHSEAARQHPLDFKTVGEYTHASFLSRVSLVGDTEDGREGGMAFIVALLFAVTDKAHSLFSPGSAFCSSSSSSSSSSSVSTSASSTMTRYALRLQNAVSIAVANILHSVDTFFRWEYGWMLALETKKLAHSDRLLLLLSKTIPAPSPRG